MRVLMDLSACQDCLFYVANGDLPDDSRDLEADIQATVGEPSGRLVCGDDDSEEFSWSACECCGSQLGGSRHTLRLLGE